MKIFISHSSQDEELVNAFMDLFQTQFNLTRQNFFNTSDFQLELGGNWIEEIKTAMQESTLVLPIITPNYLDSHFCLCELGAAWVKDTQLFPIIVPPLTHRALDATPYRAWKQSVTLDSEEGMTRLYDAFVKNKIGTDPSVTRFLKRVRTFLSQTLEPFIEAMKKKEVVTSELVKELRLEAARYKEAFDKSDDELVALQKENAQLRKVKDAVEVKAIDRAKMDEWDTFLDAVEKVALALKPLNNAVATVLYYDYKGQSFIPEPQERSILIGDENKGLVRFDQGWEPDYAHPDMRKAQYALDQFKTVLRQIGDIIEERFEEENEGIRLGLEFSPFWESFFRVKIYQTDI